MGWTTRQAETIQNADAVVNLWTGAVGSGKTVGSLWAFLLYVAQAPTSGDIVIVGRTRDSIGRNVLTPLADPAVFGPFARHTHYNHGAPRGTIMGREVWIIGASDVRAETTLRGLNCVGAYVDEITLIDETFWMQLQQRIRIDDVQIFATTNPDGPAHWVKRHIIDKAVPNGHRVFQFTIHDNPHVSKDYYPRLMRELTGLWRRRMIDGEWCMAEGSVYEVWDPARHVIAAADMPRIARTVAMGIDAGQEHETRGYLIGITDEPRPRLAVLDEWAPKKGLSDYHLSESLRAWLAMRPDWAPEWVYVDPAALSLRTQLFNDGVTPAKAGNSVVPGIRVVGSLLATDSLIVSDRCPHLIQRLPGYAWDPKATAKGLDKPIKAMDDEADALRYGIYSSRGFWGNSVELLSAPTPEADDEMAAQIV